MPTLSRRDLRRLVIALERSAVPVADICREFDVAASTAYRWIAEAYDAETGAGRIPSPNEFALRLDHSRCEHDPIQVGEATVCLTCYVSGFDDHPKMRAKPLPKDRKKYKPSPGLRGGV